MAFRNIIINEKCKLEYSLNYLICRRGNEEKRVLLDEIKLIILTTTQVTLTAYLISMLSQKKIKLIFCNEDHNPECELVPYSNNFYSYRKIKEQIKFIENQGYLWKKIIEEKIQNEYILLNNQNKIEAYNLLKEYSMNVEENDNTNREGHSAKVYFNSLFGIQFNRREANDINKYLNYGYSILISSINREIKSLGYLTELGIHHIGESNQFNLSYDLIEPLRSLVDYYVVNKLVNEENYKIKFIEILSKEVEYNNQIITLDNAIHLYIINMINYMKTNDSDYLKFIKYEL